MEKPQKEYNLTDYKKEIELLSESELLAKKEGLKAKQTVNYVYVGDGYYSNKKINIADNPDAKNRIYMRKKVAFASAMINSFLKQNCEDYAPYRAYINDHFIQTTNIPSYATANLHGKSVTFADKLSLKGMVAYNRYLLLIYDNLQKGASFVEAVYIAVGEEAEIDRDFDRSRFYTRYFLPKSIETVYTNLLKEKVINDKLKDFGLEKREDDIVTKTDDKKDFEKKEKKVATDEKKM